MARIHINPDQHRVIPLIIFLQGGRILKGMGGHHTVIMICRGYQGGRVIDAGFDIMNGRIPKKILKIIRLITAAVLCYPVPANGELMKTQHIHYPNLRDRYFEKIRSLIDHGADQ